MSEVAVNCLDSELGGSRAGQVRIEGVVGTGTPTPLKPALLASNGGLSLHLRSVSGNLK